MKQQTRFAAAVQVRAAAVVYVYMCVPLAVAVEMAKSVE